MAKVKVTSNFQILDLMDRFMDARTANDLGKTVAQEAKAMIEEGQSPVRGYGRFDAYKDRTVYPGKLKDARPVNLTLTGEMLRGYWYRLTGRSVEVGMVRGSADRKEIAGFHQDGTPNMSQRKMVPGPGEEWAPSIMRSISNLYAKRLAFLIRQSNKKR